MASTQVYQPNFPSPSGPSEGNTNQIGPNSSYSRGQPAQSQSRSPSPASQPPRQQDTFMKESFGQFGGSPAQQTQQYQNPLNDQNPQHQSPYPPTQDHSIPEKNPGSPHSQQYQQPFGQPSSNPFDQLGPRPQGQPINSQQAQQGLNNQNNMNRPAKRDLIEDQCVKLGELETPELGKHVSLKHNSGNLIVEKDLTTTTSFDSNALLQHFKHRQSLQHPNLVTLIEYRAEEKITFPMPKFQVKAFYEYYKDNLKYIKEMRKQAKVQFREREIVDFAYNMVKD